MEKVTPGLEIGLTNDRSHVEIVHRDAASHSSSASSIVLLPRHARYLANLLVDYASEAEETEGDQDAKFVRG